MHFGDSKTTLILTSLEHPTIFIGCHLGSRDVLGMGDRAVCKLGEVPVFLEITFSGQGDTVNNPDHSRQW